MLTGRISLATASRGRATAALGSDGAAERGPGRSPPTTRTRRRRVEAAASGARAGDAAGVDLLRDRPAGVPRQAERERDPRALDLDRGRVRGRPLAARPAARLGHSARQYRAAGWRSAATCAPASPDRPTERDSGDGAAAFLCGKERADRRAARADLDHRRVPRSLADPGQQASQVWEERFGLEAYLPLIRDAATRALAAGETRAASPRVVSSPTRARPRPRASSSRAGCPASRRHRLQRRRGHRIGLPTSRPRPDGRDDPAHQRRRRVRRQ